MLFKPLEQLLFSRVCSLFILLKYAVYEGVLEIPALRGGMFHPDGD